MMDPVAISKRLSYVLRHRPDSVGLALDPNGWVAVGDLLATLAAAGFPVTRAELDAVVAGNDKRRHHVHLSGDEATARRVGARRQGEVAILTVDAAAMAADGYPFYRSANGVWLTDHVPPGYLR